MSPRKGAQEWSSWTRRLTLAPTPDSNLETALAAHSTHPHLAPVYNPSLLAREPSLSADCAYYTDTNDWQTESPEGQALAKDPYPALTVYTTRLRELGEASEDSRGSQSPSMLLAHAYVRYRTLNI